MLTILPIHHQRCRRRHPLARALMLLVALMLPLLGQHTHADTAQSHAPYARQAGEGHCAHHADAQADKAASCHCIDACAGGVLLPASTLPIDPVQSAAKPRFFSVHVAPPALALTPPYRPPIARIASA